MKHHLWEACAASALIVASASAASAQTLHDVKNFNIAPQSLDSALIAFSEQTGIQVVASSDLVAGKKSKGFRGAAVASITLRGLLDGTGLTFKPRGDSTVSIIRSARAKQSAPRENRTGSDGNSMPDRGQKEDPTTAGDSVSRSDQAVARKLGVKASKIEEIVVTGSSIRGVIPKSSPLEVYTQADFSALGVTTVDQFLSAMPQNLNSNAPIGSNVIGRALNVRNINAPDLRGLGYGATLTLINGRRMPLANVGRASDTSMIPLGAVKRVEVLTDGASSVYGSDAVGGVINFVLVDDYEGAYTSGSYTTRTDGGYDAYQMDQTLGTSWKGGGIVGTFSVNNSGPFGVESADFTDAHLTTLAPKDDRYSGYVSVHQKLGDKVEIFSDALYTDRSTYSVERSDAFAATYANETKSKQTVGTLGVRADLASDLRFELIGTYGQLDDSLRVMEQDDSGDSGDFTSASTFDSLEITAKVDGTLLHMGDRAVMFALGGGYLKQHLNRSPMNLTRHTKYAFGELQVPLVVEGQDIPFVNRLELNVSSRYTKSDDFSSSFDPKLGLLWQVTGDLALRGTWSKAFRAPELSQLAPLPAVYEILPVVSDAGVFPDPFSSDQSTVYLATPDPTNPNLGPERSDAITLGLDYSPKAIDGLNLSVTYYRINYTDRVAYPPSTISIATHPEQYPDLITDQVDTQTIQSLLSNAFGIFNYGDSSFVMEWDPAVIASQVTRVIHNGLRNIAAQRTSGLDVSVKYSGDLGDAKLDTGAAFTYMLKNEEQATAGSTPIQRVDTVTFPVDLRGRAWVGLQQGGWSGRVTMNYVDSYRNTSVLPEERISSWTTFNLGLSYNFSEDRRDLFGGMRIGLNVQNIFDRDPPFVASATQGFGVNDGVNFDPANHNPFGRLITLSLSKKW